MKKKLRILAFTLAAVFVFAACDSSGDDDTTPPPPPPPVNNPAKGEMTAETADKIFVTSEVEGGVQIDQFIDLAALTAYIDAGSQAADAPSGPKKAKGDKTLVLNKIGDAFILSIADNAFNPDAKEGTAKLTGFNVKLPEKLTSIGADSFKGAGIKTLLVPETVQTALGDALTAAASSAGAVAVAVADEEDDALVLGDGVFPQPDGSLYINAVIYDETGENVFTGSNKWVGVWNSRPWVEEGDGNEAGTLLTRSKIENGWLTISIPAPTSFVRMGPEDYFNPADMKCAGLTLFILDDENEVPTENDGLELGLHRDNETGGIWYADKSGTAIGEIKDEDGVVEEILNINLRKGWNFVFDNMEDETKEVASTQDGSGEGFRWRIDPR